MLIFLNARLCLCPELYRRVFLFVSHVAFLVRLIPPGLYSVCECVEVSVRSHWHPEPESVGHSPFCPSVKPEEVPLGDFCGCQGTLPSTVRCSPPIPSSSPFFLPLPTSFSLSSSSQLPPQLCPLAIGPLPGACPVYLTQSGEQSPRHINTQDAHEYCMLTVTLRLV